MRKTKSASRSQTKVAIHYELQIVDGPNRFGVMTGKVKSSLLDPELHPEQVAKVSITGCSKTSHGQPVFRISEFEVNSLVDYLRNQSTVRRVIATELPRYLGRRSRRGVSTLPRTTIAMLTLNPRIVQTSESLDFLKKAIPKLNVASIIAKSDNPNTQSSYTVSIDIEPDDNEHMLLATFRDGELVEFCAE